MLSFPILLFLWSVSEKRLYELQHSWSTIPFLEQLLSALWWRSSTICQGSTQQWAHLVFFFPLFIFIDCTALALFYAREDGRDIMARLLVSYKQAWLLLASRIIHARISSWKEKITHCHSIKVDRLRTWEHKFRYCLETTFVQRSCTISNSFAAFQMFANRRMRLPTLEFLISTVRCQLLTLQSIYW